MKKELVMINGDEVTVGVAGNPNHVRIKLNPTAGVAFVDMTPEQARELALLLDAFATIVEPQESKVDE